MKKTISLKGIVYQGSGFLLTKFLDIFSIYAYNIVNEF